MGCPSHWRCSRIWCVRPDLGCRAARTPHAHAGGKSSYRGCSSNHCKRTRRGREARGGGEGAGPSAGPASCDPTWHLTRVVVPSKDSGVNSVAAGCAGDKVHTQPHRDRPPLSAPSVWSQPHVRRRGRAHYTLRTTWALRRIPPPPTPAPVGQDRNPRPPPCRRGGSRAHPAFPTRTGWGRTPPPPLCHPRHEPHRGWTGHTRLCHGRPPTTPPHHHTTRVHRARCACARTRARE
jgi:hypothetical protein